MTDDGRLRRSRDGGGIHARHGRDRRRCRNRHGNGGTAAGRRAGRGLHAHVTSLVVDDTRCRRRRRSAGRRSCGCSRRLRRQLGLGLPGGIHVLLLLMVIHLVAMLSTYLLAFADWAFSLVRMRAFCLAKKAHAKKKNRVKLRGLRVAGCGKAVRNDGETAAGEVGCQPHNFALTWQRSRKTETSSGWRKGEISCVLSGIDDFWGILHVLSDFRPFASSGTSCACLKIRGPVC